VRLLFASTAGAGHFSPLVPWIDGALRRGHEVLVVGPPELADQAASRYPFRAGGSADPEDVRAITQRLVALTHEEAGPLMIGEVFARLNSGALLPALRDTLEEWRPELVLRDPTEFASAVAARIAGVPQCRIAHGLAAGEASMLDHAGPVLEELHAGTSRTIVASPYYTLFPEQVDPSPFPKTFRYRNPADPLGDSSSLPEWWGDRSAPLVYMTFGTVGPKMPQMLDVYRRALAAASGLKANVLMTVGTDLRIADLGELPPNVHVEPWVTQHRVMSQAKVVLSHGGSGTT
jgi:UDP:flavonoid glycosyltransferase YjiC (YdhE family)